VLLKNNVKKVFAVDVGTKQLHDRIKSDPRVINLEKTHVRELTPSIITDNCDGCVIDVSFISLQKIFPFLHSFIRPEGFTIALVKPQFEVGKNNVGKGGIVKDTKLYKIVIEDIKKSASLNNLAYIDHIESPILGGDGNREFLMLLKRTKN
jgi:23S rRNA (cytidine1920-2'-O)/16S rRNA (cytidine1409-2'-O)-methyltransferase